MAAIIAKVFIVMTLLFEVITIATGSAFYPVFGAAAGIIAACLAIQFLLGRLEKASKHSTKKTVFLAG
jgi:hypothetical protein